MTKGQEPQFSLLWPVLQSYSVAEEQIWGSSELQAPGSPSNSSTYDAAAEPNLALEFIRVNWPSRTVDSSDADDTPSERTQALLKFVETYGALDRGNQNSNVDEGSRLPLHPLPWALLHAGALDLVVTLNGALATGQVDLVDSQCDAWETLRRQSGILMPCGRAVGTLGNQEALPRGQEQQVQWITAQLLNPNLGGVRKIQDGREIIAFEALYELLHSQVASWCARAQFGQCDGCGGFFPQTDGRQKYCPALLGLKESRCATRDRTRRHRGKGAATPHRRRPAVFLLRQHND